MITADNYEQYLYQYAEGMLDESQRRMVERFLDQHEELKEELSLYVESPEVTGLDVVMPGKQRLKRYPKMQMVWKMIAAACVAAVVLVPFCFRIIGNNESTVLADNRQSELPGSVENELPVSAPVAPVNREEIVAKEEYCLSLPPTVNECDIDCWQASAHEETIQEVMGIIDKTDTIIYDGVLNETPTTYVISTSNLIAYGHSPCDTMQTDLLIAYSNLPDVKTQLYNIASSYYMKIGHQWAEIQNDMIALADKLQIR